MLWHIFQVFKRLILDWSMSKVNIDKLFCTHIIIRVRPRFLIFSISTRNMFMNRFGSLCDIIFRERLASYKPFKLCRKPTSVAFPVFCLSHFLCCFLVHICCIFFKSSNFNNFKITPIFIFVLFPIESKFTTFCLKSIELQYCKYKLMVATSGT